MVTLADVLALAPTREADPVVRAGSAGLAERPVRWVHSSEVLEVAGLLRGDELLLTGGQALLSRPLSVQHGYLASLAAAGLAALAVETAGSRPLDAALVEHAEQLGVVLIELRTRAPFVDIAEQANRTIVNSRAVAHQRIDQLSARIARHIAGSGPSIPPILTMISEDLGATVRLTGADGVLLGEAGTSLSSSGPPGSPRTPASPEVAESPARSSPTDAPAPRADEAAVRGMIRVAGQAAAELEVRSPDGDPVELEMAVDHLASILSLALAESLHPGPATIAGRQLLRGILDGAGPTMLHRRWEEAGLDPDHAALVVLMTPARRAGGHAAVERLLRSRGATALSLAADDDLIVLLAGAVSRLRDDRPALLRALGETVPGTSLTVAVGPPVHDPGLSPISLGEARAALVGARRPGTVVDAVARFDARLLHDDPSREVVDVYVAAAVGALQDWDARHGTSLVATLDTWASHGCSTTAAARVLHIERQSMHKRIAKIIELLGSDPRKDGRLLSVHLAARAALSAARGRR